jgi:hypothetical protein
MNMDNTNTDSKDARDAGLPANSADPDRNLALELVRATEAAAIACSRYMGFGDKEQIDQAAVDAMRPVLGCCLRRCSKSRRRWAYRSGRCYSD